MDNTAIWTTGNERDRNKTDNSIIGNPGYGQYSNMDNRERTG